MATAITIVSWVVVAILTSELFGYLIHRLLHSGRIAWLSRRHMIHHLQLYGPLDPKRPDGPYQDATDDRVSLGNVGMEWLVSGAALLAAMLVLLRLLHVPAFYQGVFLGTSLLWSFAMFSYLHDRMHVHGFWMEKNRLLKRWFRGARKRHDIHHWALNDEGFMDRNFGIAFFLFDRLFDTHAEQWQTFNQRGYKEARRRFADLLDERTDNTKTPTLPMDEPNGIENQRIEPQRCRLVESMNVGNVRILDRRPLRD